MDVHTNSDSIKTNEDFKCFKKLPFSASERELIVALVRERPIIEDKRTNANNILLKKQAWEDLAVAFNAQPYVSQRKTVQLKRCWENIKSQRKKELSQESWSMRRTGGGPPQGGSAASSDNIVDIICPFINMTVPGVIDSNSIESVKKLESEFDVRKRRCTMNIEHDQALHELRIQREKILIEREKNLLEYEKKVHGLQLEKLKLEIDRLRNNKN